MRLIPREEKFFDMLAKISENVILGAKALEDLLNNYENIEEKAKKILDIEHEGDILVHEIIETLNRTFITPIDREDIHSLTSQMDDVLDYIEATADRFLLYKINKPTPDVLRMTKIVVEAIREVNKAIMELKDLKRPRRILDRCIEVNRLENEGDKISREIFAKLFESTNNTIDVIKWKEIYEHLEMATDKCEDVANTIESVVVKYA